LKNAIRIKYQKLSAPPSSQSNLGSNSEASILNELVSEYLDKLFISAIKLGELTTDQKDEFVHELLANDLKEFVPRKRNSGSSKSIGFNRISDGELSSTDVNVESSTIIQLTTQPGGIPGIDESKEGNKSNSLEGLSEKELEYLLSSVESWQLATPRSITIFYYRYLLCKNLLLSKYDKLGNTPIWRDENAIKGLICAILEFSTAHDPSKISSKKQEVALDKSTQRIEIAKGQVQIDRQDYFYMLEIFEIIVAY
jgi:hypothetical protein